MTVFIANAEREQNVMSKKGECTCKSGSMETLTQEEHYSVASC